MGLDEMLKRCKSLRVLEGAEAAAFLRERAEKQAKEAVRTNNRLIERDNKLLVERLDAPSFPLKPKAIKVTTEQARAWAEAAGLTWDDRFEKPMLRVIPWRLSDERPDRHGDIVRQNWVLDNFKKNPLLLDCHRWEDDPIGNVIHVEVTNVSDPDFTGKATMGYCLFAPGEVSSRADDVFRLASARFMRAGSVGFYPQRIITIQDDAERQQLGLGRWGVIYDLNELVEFSICSVPANAGAIQTSLKRGVKDGLLDASHIKAVETSLQHSREAFKADEEFDAFAKEATDLARTTLQKNEGETPEPEAKEEEDEVSAKLAALEQQIVLLAGSVEKLSTSVKSAIVSMTDAFTGLSEATKALYANQQQLEAKDDDDVFEDDDDDEDELEDEEDADEEDAGFLDDDEDEDDDEEDADDDDPL